MSVWWAAGLGLTAGLIAGPFLAAIYSAGRLSETTRAVEGRDTDTIIFVLIVTNALLGGILGVLLFLALR
jgi:hypothetical protein